MYVCIYTYILYIYIYIYIYIQQWEAIWFSRIQFYMQCSVRIPFSFSYKVFRIWKTALHDQQFINSKVLDGKIQKYLPYNGDFPGKTTTRSCNLGTFIKASVTRFAACSLSFAILWKWQSPNLIPIFALNIEITIFYYSINTKLAML